MIVLLWIVGLFLVAVGALAVAVRRARRRDRELCSRVPIDQVHRWIRGMLQRFVPGGYVIAHANGGDGFLQVAVTGREGTWRQVELGLPDADWCRTHFDRAVETLPGVATDWTLEHTPDNPDVPRFLRVSIAGQWQSVLQRTTELLHRAAEVLELPPDQTYTIESRGADHPDYVREIADELDRIPDGRWLLGRMTRWLRRHADALERAR